MSTLIRRHDRGIDAASLVDEAEVDESRQQQQLPNSEQRGPTAISWLTAALAAHALLALTMGAVALIAPENLLIYADAAQASACARCAMAFDLARAFGVVNLFMGHLAARFLVAARCGRDYTTPQSVAHGRALLVPMALSMLFSLALRVHFIAGGHFSSAEWVSLVVSALLACAYVAASRLALFV
ncbi:hypothetical protein pkur_cds_360 [Pandoravirus kuranda]|uniref:Transmembrane protein n=2 Tax=Pandoravirus TaxID=2060084 RepID=A0AA95J6L5_9VIRU|nr:hypothetical protein pneo_cds_397 [Pandoravirus neocaledonia]AVK76004.1 hypothetical protein pneo_cds_397 [Pandoravirus neocaledonia]WBR14535.1 hypothetical protein pkur_cds_360 [Pandoravirus kuranda]